MCRDLLANTVIENYTFELVRLSAMLRASVIVFPGSNCDRDVKTALEAITGFPVKMVWHGDASVPSSDLIVLPGGFSYGDYLRCGAMAAHSPIMRDVIAKAKAGTPVLGICNGFQILCESGLLPGVLMRNASLHFICRDVHLKVENDKTFFTNCYRKGEVIRVPIAHAEGNYFADAETLDRLEGEGQVVFRYSRRAMARSRRETSPNGAQRNIAGITDATGRILGIMPHPERLYREGARRHRRPARVRERARLRACRRGVARTPRPRSSQTKKGADRRPLPHFRAPRTVRWTSATPDARRLASLADGDRLQRTADSAPWRSQADASNMAFMTSSPFACFLVCDDEDRAVRVGRGIAGPASPGMRMRLRSDAAQCSSANSVQQTKKGAGRDPLPFTHDPSGRNSEGPASLRLVGRTIEYARAHLARTGTAEELGRPAGAGIDLEAAAGKDRNDDAGARRIEAALAAVGVGQHDRQVAGLVLGFKVADGMLAADLEAKAVARGHDLVVATPDGLAGRCRHKRRLQPVLQPLLLQQRSMSPFSWLCSS